VKAVRRVTGTVAVLDRADVDTDQIVPKQFLKSIERTGFGEALFYDWMQDPAFELHRPEFVGASILVTGPNFGCGSSREHAAWALRDFGFEVVIAPSFGDIFRTNAIKTGLLPVTLAAEQVRALHEARRLTVDLEAQTIEHGDDVLMFEFDAFAKHCLLNGLDDIALTLEHEQTISQFEARNRPPISTLAL